MYQTCLSAYQYEAGRENLNAKKINREIGFLFFAVKITVAAWPTLCISFLISNCLLKNAKNKV